MEPTIKSPGMEATLENLFGKNRVETINENRCMSCNGSADNFRDALSMREYSISGLCQKCQDEIWGGLK